MAKLSPTKPMSSLRRLFSLGVKMRKAFSHSLVRSCRRFLASSTRDTNIGFWDTLHPRLATWRPYGSADANRGRPPRGTWVAPALSRGAQWEEREQRKDYTKGGKGQVGKLFVGDAQMTNRVRT